MTRGFPWLAVLLVVPWVLLEAAFPAPRSAAAARGVFVAMIGAAVGVAWVLTRLGAYQRWIWGIGAGGIVASMLLVFFQTGARWLFSTLIVLVLGAVARGIYLFAIHPRRV